MKTRLIWSLILMSATWFSSTQLSFAGEDSEPKMYKQKNWNDEEHTTLVCEGYCCSDSQEVCGLFNWPWNYPVCGLPAEEAYCTSQQLPQIHYVTYEEGNPWD